MIYTKSIYPVLIIMVALWLRASWYIVFWFSLAILWAYLHQASMAREETKAPRVIQHAAMVGEIASIPIVTEFKTQFKFHLRQLNQKPVKAYVLLTCFNHCPVFKVGQLWQLQAKLKRPENLGNPGHFNFRERLQAEHIQWVGYLKPGQNQLLRAKQQNNMLAIRESLAARLALLLPNSSTLGIIEALTLGLTSHIDKSQWELFRHTGTTHLMVISGAHIYLVANLFYHLMDWFWRRSSYLCLYRPAMQAASLGGLLMGFFYALLAGFAIPAQRAVIACTVLLLRYFSKRYYSSWQAWRYALMLIIVIEPHAVLLPGFYLSFIAVAILMVASQRIPYQGLKKLIALQAACLIGLLPFTLYWFSYGALNGLFANLIAIPLVGYLIVPLSLLSLLLSQLTTQPWVLWPTDYLIKGLLIFLQAIDKFNYLNLNFSLVNFSNLFALSSALVILFILPLRSWLAGASLLILAVLFPYVPKLKPNTARLDVLDVGQGLAIVISTTNHVLLYDTGMKFYQGGDMAQMAIIPYLTTRGIKKIDKIIISHSDLDHRGGLASVEDKYGQVELLVDNPQFYHRGTKCHEYATWQWDGITFRFLPIYLSKKNKNNSSCVLQIITPSGNALITGDIEKEAERYLIRHYPKQLASDILVVAHHGSKTSSTDAFIAQVLPKFALISAGFDNRYHFPHQQTLETLKRYNSKILNTIDCGMITVEFNTNSQGIKPSCYKAH
ncbi:DNA internalization-related competence protein ComEC/Rec2 [Legionella sp. D16C41]|uniref:DNA internalization-related competence protein ComEC/Rec2 n=1 Tax=Legionella sp. D16C41 TaxID=3402688 RepID=UPI003AF70103